MQRTATKSASFSTWRCRQQKMRTDQHRSQLDENAKRFFCLNSLRGNSAARPVLTGPPKLFLLACTVIVPRQATVIPPSMVMLFPPSTASTILLAAARSMSALTEQSVRIAFRLQRELVAVRLEGDIAPACEQA